MFKAKLMNIMRSRGIQIAEFDALLAECEKLRYTATVAMAEDVVGDGYAAFLEEVARLPENERFAGLKTSAEDKIADIVHVNLLGHRIGDVAGLLEFRRDGAFKFAAKPREVTEVAISLRPAKLNGMTGRFGSPLSCRGITGGFVLAVREELGEQDKAALLDMFTDPADKAAIEKLFIESHLRVVSFNE